MGSAMRCSGWPGCSRAAVLPSGRSRMIGPASRSRRTCVMAGAPATRSTSTGQRSASASQAAIRSTEGCVLSPTTTARLTCSKGGWSSVAAMSPRHRVVRVQARSESPSEYTVARRRRAADGESALTVSVMRRCAILPTGCSAGFSGTS